MNLTPARRHGLEVLAIDGIARRSNFTSAYHDLVTPAWHRIDRRVERAAVEKGLDCVTWGSGRDLLDRNAANAAPMCSDCQLRFEAAP